MEWGSAFPWNEAISDQRKSLSDVRFLRRGLFESLLKKASSYFPVVGSSGLGTSPAKETAHHIRWRFGIAVSGRRQKDGLNGKGKGFLQVLSGPIGVTWPGAGSKTQDGQGLDFFGALQCRVIRNRIPKDQSRNPCSFPLQDFRGFHTHRTACAVSPKSKARGVERAEQGIFGI